MPHPCNNPGNSATRLSFRCRRSRRMNLFPQDSSLRLAPSLRYQNGTAKISKINCSTHPKKSKWLSFSSHLTSRDLT